MDKPLAYFLTWTCYGTWIASAEEKPERVLNDLKVYATRRLKERTSAARTKYWTEHGSTRYLWNEDSLQRALKYVLDEQGEMLSVYVRKDP